MELKLDQWATTPPAGYPGTIPPPPGKRAAGFANGEEPPAGYFNHAWDALTDMQNELANLIAGAGMTPVESDLTQVSTAIERISSRRAELSGITQWVDLRVTGAANTTRSIDAGAEAVVAVGGSPTMIHTLTNTAFAWVTPSAAASYAGQFNDVHWSQFLRFIAVGTVGEIQTSLDGLAWLRAATGGPDLNGASSGFDCAVVVGNAGVIKVGTGFGDVETWTAATSAFPSESMNAVAWSETLQKFCAVGTNAKIQCGDYTGMTWVAATAGPAGTAALKGVIWSEKHQVFIAWDFGQVFTSIDGMTWRGPTAVTYPGGFDIASVVALDEHLAVFSSLDHNYVLMMRVAELYAPSPQERWVLLSPINASTQDDDYFVDVLHVWPGPPPGFSSAPKYLFNGRLLGVTKNGKVRATHYFG
jgi:hypothetical protein